MCGRRISEYLAARRRAREPDLFCGWDNGSGSAIAANVV